jgi:hypothetical protein
MPRWYGTFGVSTSLGSRYVVLEAETREAASMLMDRRFPRWSNVYSQEQWDVKNWAGHTQAQRLGLTEATPMEEEQYRENWNPDHQRG